MRISDWSSDVCSSDLLTQSPLRPPATIAPASCLAAVVSPRRRHRAPPPQADADAAARASPPRTADAHPHNAACPLQADRQSVVRGKRLSVRVDLGGRRIIKKKKQIDVIMMQQQ